MFEKQGFTPKSVLVIGTPNTIKQELYKFNNFKYFEPNNKEINQLSSTIFNFNKGIDKQKQVQKARKICKKYINNRAEIVILGCTEFAVMLAKENFPKINTLDVLVDATMRKFFTLSQ